MRRLALTVIAVVSFLVCFFAAWRTVPSDEPHAAVPESSLPVSHSVPPAATAAAGRLLKEMERQVSQSLEGGGPYSGERLVELCAGVRRNESLAFDTVALFADGWAKADPAGMHEWFAARGDFNLRAADGFGFTFKSTIFAAWAEKDPDTALAAAANLKDYVALDAVISALLRTDPARALGAAQKHLALLAAGGAAWLPRDTPGTWEMFCGLPPGADRGRLMASWLRSRMVSGDTTVEEMERFWGDAPDAVRKDLAAAGYTLLQKEAPLDLPAPADGAALPPPKEQPRRPVALEGLEEMARAHAEQSATSDAAARFLSTHGPAWAERDPGAAVQWAMTHLQGRSRVNETAALFRHAAGNFDAALAAWRVLPDGMLKARAAGALAAGAPADKADEVIQLLDSLPPADRKVAEAQRHGR